MFKRQTNRQQPHHAEFYSASHTRLMIDENQVIKRNEVMPNAEASKKYYVFSWIAALASLFRNDAKRERFCSLFPLPFSLTPAFTLAEVLITLGIIGVVAALTIPNLVKNYQKQETVTKLKKVYTTLAQAGKQSENDNGPCNEWVFGTNGDADSIKIAFDTYIGSYLKVLKYCNSYSDCGYLSNTAIKSIQGDARFAVVDNSQGPTLLLQDGSVLKFQNIPLYINIFVDINGPKPPNTYTRDVFRFGLYKNAGIMPYGYNFTGSGLCSNIDYGYACATKIMRDGWQIADDYPWN